MQSIPIFRTAHLIPHIQFLRKLGAPVERGLRNAKLPLMIFDQPDAYLPLLHAMRFLTEISRNEGIDTLGLRGIERCSATDLNQYLVAALCEAPSLYTALQAFITFAHRDNMSVRWWIETETDNVKIHSLLDLPSDMEGLPYSEWRQSMAVVDVVRAFAGATWSPGEMAFRSVAQPGPYAVERYPDTRFLTGQRSAWISVPRSLLSLPPRIKRTAGKPAMTVSAAVETDMEVPMALKLVLQSYLGEGYPAIELAAELSSTSVRTLQRRLKQYNLSYSTLVQQAQFEYARELLKNPDIRTLDIAYAVGYEDPSNFARAFRRIAGVSPREYRAQLRLQ